MTKSNSRLMNALQYVNMQDTAAIKVSHARHGEYGLMVICKPPCFAI